MISGVNANKAIGIIFALILIWLVQTGAVALATALVIVAIIYTAIAIADAIRETRP